MTNKFFGSRGWSFAACFLATPMLAHSNATTVIAQDYQTSIVGTDFDFITASDPSMFAGLKFVRHGKAEMPDKREGSGGLFQQAYVFKAVFKDNTAIDLFIDAKFGSQQTAQAEAMRYVHPLGKLPTALRAGVKRLVVHRGGRDTTAFSDEGLIVLYADNATQRIATHDLEETTFHESVHAAWDAKHAGGEGWLRAQVADGAYVTMYAKQKPQREDLAETALFAYTLLHHPDRIPEEQRNKLLRTIPNRIRYIAKLLPPGKPIELLDNEKRK